MSTHSLMVCPVCDGREFAVLAEMARNPAGEEFPARAVRCRQCGLGAEERLSADPAGLYARETYDGVRDKGSGAARWARFHHESAVATARLAQLSAAVPPPLEGVQRMWADVGCSTGAMLAVARRHDWAVLGVEADPAAAAEVTRLLGVPVLDFSAWAHLANGPAGLNVVSFFDVVEHLLDPIGALKLAAKTLLPDGILVIEVPDLDAAPADFAAWHHRRITPDVTEHVWHFDAGSLDRLRARHLPRLVPQLVNRPVPGRLQIAWRKLPDPPPSGPGGAAAARPRLTAVGEPGPAGTNGARHRTAAHAG